MPRLVDQFQAPANLSLESIVQHYTSEKFERNLFSKMGLNIETYDLDSDKQRSVSGNKFNIAKFTDIRTQPSPTSLHYERLGTISGKVDISFQAEDTRDGKQKITQTVDHSLKSTVPLPGINGAINQGFSLAITEMEKDIAADIVGKIEPTPLN